jgi:RNAse (barnase) inhibitor barstar
MQQLLSLAINAHVCGVEGTQETTLPEEEIPPYAPIIFVTRTYAEWLNNATDFMLPIKVYAIPQDIESLEEYYQELEDYYAYARHVVNNLWSAGAPWDIVMSLMPEELYTTEIDTLPVTVGMPGSQDREAQEEAKCAIERLFLAARHLVDEAEKFALPHYMFLNLLPHEIYRGVQEKLARSGEFPVVGTNPEGEI